MKLNKNTSVEASEANKTNTLRSLTDNCLFTQRPEKNASRTIAEIQHLLHGHHSPPAELHTQNAALRQARDELQAANVDLEAFNYSVAHELRQHLVTINCYCQVVRELHDRDHDKQSQEYIEEIYQGTLAMDRLIGTLLAFSNVGTFKLRRQPVDLSTIAKSLVAERILAATACRCTFHITPGILVNADPELLRIVLSNLIGNACRYAGNREGTEIEFNVTSVDGKQVCFVRDNGPGFDMALADRLFLPFQRLPGTAVKGNGIGLATVERIIRRHGGRVWAESEAGKGATFFFTLD